MSLQPTVSQGNRTSDDALGVDPLVVFDLIPVSLHIEGFQVLAGNLSMSLLSRFAASHQADFSGKLLFGHGLVELLQNLQDRYRGQHHFGALLLIIGDFRHCQFLLATPLRGGSLRKCSVTGTA